MKINGKNNDSRSYDIIGDVHGCFDELVSLLRKRGYTVQNGVWQHPRRKVLYIGDLINRGPRSLAVLELVRSMHESGNADVLCGNHEFNFIAWHTKSSGGGFVRPHNEHNFMQLKRTLEEFDANPHLLEGYIDWMKTLPLFMETPAFRAVHACWDQEQIQKAVLGRFPSTLESSAFIQEAATPGTEAFFYVEQLLKGPEYRLPPAYEFSDNDGNRRDTARVKWWHRDRPLAAILMNVKNCDVPDNQVFRGHLPTVMKDKPTFIGHYC